MLGQKKINRSILLSEFHLPQNLLITFGQTNSEETQTATSIVYKIPMIQRGFTLNKVKKLSHVAIPMKKKTIS